MILKTHLFLLSTFSFKRKHNNKCISHMKKAAFRRTSSPKAAFSRFSGDIASLSERILRIAFIYVYLFWIFCRGIFPILQGLDRLSNKEPDWTHQSSGARHPQVHCLTESLHQWLSQSALNLVLRLGLALGLDLVSPLTAEVLLLPQGPKAADHQWLWYPDLQYSRLLSRRWHYINKDGRCRRWHWCRW